MIQDLYGWQGPGVNASAPTSNPQRVRLEVDANGNPRLEALLFVPSTLQGNLVIGQPYYVAFGSANGQVAQVAAPAGNATSGVLRQIAVLQADQANTGSVPTTGTYAWFAVEGYCNILVEGTVAIAKGDFLKSNSTVKSGALIEDASTQSANSVAIALAAQGAAGNVLTACYLLGGFGYIA